MHYVRSCDRAVNDRSSRSRAALWLGILATAAVAFVAVAQLGPRRKHLEYYLGPGSLGIDSETLMLEFDRRGHLARLEVVQG
jgi:hypothetical protein